MAITAKINTKVTRYAMIKPLLVFPVACGLLLAFVSPGSASSDDRIDSALATAPAWVAEIDAGRYEESYESACNAMHEKTPENQWVQVLSTLRSPWGKVVSRKEISHLYKPDGYEGAMGEFIVITYDTSFEKLSPATETVVLKWEDGKWRGAGYNAGPKPNPDAAVDQTSPQTETTTTTTKTPPQ